MTRSATKDVTKTRRGAVVTSGRGAKNGKDTVKRSRRQFARRQWARRWLTWKYILGAVVVLGLLGGGGYLLLFSDQLDAERTEIEGIDLLREEQVLDAAQVPLGRPLARLDIDAVERRVGNLAAVGEVEVSRSWPHTVSIDITERVPVAVVRRGSVWRAVDAEGIEFFSYRAAPRGLPRVTAALDADVDSLREVAAVVAALPDEIRGITDFVQLKSVDEIDLALKNGRRVRWGSAENSTQKAEVLLALLARKAQVYDVSVPGQPTTTG